MVGFTNCKDKVAQVYQELDLGDILEVEAIPEEEEGEGVAKEETIRTKELVVEGPKLEVVAIKDPEEHATAPEINT